MNVFIADIIGGKSGMHYYHTALYDLFKENGYKLNILSNYNFSKVQFFPNIFEGNFFSKILKLIWSIIKYLLFVLGLKRDDVLIYFTFGTSIDLILITITSLQKNSFVDIHEITVLDNKSPQMLNVFKYLYKNIVRNIIYHSTSTLKVVNSYGFIGTTLFVPHLHYNYSLLFDEENISMEVESSIMSSRINLVFFGDLRPSKGIDLLINIINQIEIKQCNIAINFIIAGQDTFNKLKTYLKKDLQYQNVKFIIRYINDDELKYLFSKIDYVLMPYKKNTQSGILETAFRFKKPVLFSNIQDFQQLLAKYSSFGHIINFDNYVNFCSDMKNIFIKRESFEYYNKSDVENYSNKDIFNKFVKEMISAVIH